MTRHDMELDDLFEIILKSITTISDSMAKEFILDLKLELRIFSKAYLDFIKIIKDNCETT